MATQICPECNQINYVTVGVAAYCGNCRALIDTTIPTATFRSRLRAAIAQEDFTQFPVREDDSTLDDAQVGDEGDSKASITQELKMPEDDPADTSNMGGALMQGGLILRDVLTGKRFHIKADDLDEIVIGRVSSDSSYKPTVDLTLVDGHKYGVSRLHATLRRAGSLLVLTDKASINGTFLNGVKLVPEQERIVRDKDEIWLGRVRLQVIYVNVPSEQY